MNMPEIKDINKNAVIIFCRYPAEGKVKKRLAEITGSAFAAECYRLFVEKLISECKKINSGETQCFIFYSDPLDKKIVKEWLGPGFEYFPQKGSGIGERMHNSYKKIFNIGFKKVLLIGTDIPDLSADVINHSLIDLDNADYVIGPALDGGFYLLGMKKHNAHIFDNIKWSNENVLNSLIQKISADDKTIAYAEELTDIDTIDDLRNWLNSINENYSNDLKGIIRTMLPED